MRPLRATITLTPGSALSVISLLNAAVSISSRCGDTPTLAGFAIATGAAIGVTRCCAGAVAVAASKNAALQSRAADWRNGLTAIGREGCFIRGLPYDDMFLVRHAVQACRGRITKRPCGARALRG